MERDKTILTLIRCSFWAGKSKETESKWFKCHRYPCAQLITFRYEIIHVFFVRLWLWMVTGSEVDAGVKSQQIKKSRCWPLRFILSGPQLLPESVDFRLTVKVDLSPCSTFPASYFHRDTQLTEQQRPCQKPGVCSYRLGDLRVSEVRREGHRTWVSEASSLAPGDDDVSVWIHIRGECGWDMPANKPGLYSLWLHGGTMWHIHQAVELLSWCPCRSFSLLWLLDEHVGSNVQRSSASAMEWKKQMLSYIRPGKPMNPHKTLYSYKTVGDQMFVIRC